MVSLTDICLKPLGQDCATQSILQVFSCSLFIYSILYLVKLAGFFSTWGGGVVFFAFGQTLSQHLSVFFGCGEIMILEINFLADMLKSHCLLFKHYFPLGYWGLNPTSPPPPIYPLKKSTVKWILKIMTTLEECSMQNIVLSTPLAFLVEIKILEINF